MCKTDIYAVTHVLLSYGLTVRYKLVLVVSEGIRAFVECLLVEELGFEEIAHF